MDTLILSTKKMDKAFESYYGGKEAAGVPQTIINVIPPHSTFAEVFGGNYTLTRWINTAKKLVNEKAPGVFNKYPKNQKGVKFYNFDYRDFLLYVMHEVGLFLYCDPPYLMEVRSSKRNEYECEMTTIEEHTEFLNTILQHAKNHLIAISHYPHPLYDQLLTHGWFSIDFESQTRNGQRTERLYMNYDPLKLTELQDYRYLGKDKTDRQRIKRKIARAVAGLKRLPPLEQKAIVQKIVSAG